MKFTVEKNLFLAALSRCTAVTDANSLKRDYSMVCLEAKDGRLKARAMTDIRSIVCPLDAEVTEDGSVCVDAKEFFERVKLLPEGVVSVVGSGAKLTAKTLKNARQFTMSGMPGSEYQIPQRNTGRTNTLETTTHTLAQLISAAMHAVSTDAGRPALYSLCIESSGGSIVVAATDGNRIASANTDECSGFQWLLPSPAAADMRRLCDTKADEPLTLFESSSGAIFAEFEEFEYSTKQSAGSFPPWRHGVPQTTERSVTVDRKALLEGLRAVSRASGPFGGVRFTFGKSLKLEAASADGGESSDEIECDESSPGTLGLSAQYVLDALGVLGVERVTLGSSQPKNPLLITVPGDSHFLAVISPMDV